MTHQGDRFTARLGRFVLRHKLVVVLAWLAVAVAGVFATVAVDERLTEDFAQPGQPGYEANQAIHRLYGTGGDDPPLVVDRYLCCAAKHGTGRRSPPFLPTYPHLAPL